MGFEHGFSVSVTVEAPQEAVWRALTDPQEIIRWFGWEYDGIVAEIQQIFVDEVTSFPPDRIALGWEQTIELLADGSSTTVRVMRPGPMADAPSDDLYDEMIRGWHGFLLQLRHYLERHPGEARRTIWLDGTARPQAVLSVVDAAAPGSIWLQVEHQRVTAIDAYGGGLIAVLSEPPLDADDPGKVQVTITTHGQDDAAYEELHRAWSAQWRAIAGSPTVAPEHP
jgi:hypothetical protein